MSNEEDQRHESQGVLGALLGPLRIPQRVIADIETIASALQALQHGALERLVSLDEQTGALLKAVRKLHGPLERIDRKVSDLESLELAVTARMDGLHAELNARVLSLEGEVRAMRPPIERISQDVAGLVKLLPKASDGPLARLKDTFTSS